MEQAIWKLVQIRVKHPNEPLIYSAALSLIADMFWVGEYLLNEKVNRAYREIDLIDEKAKPKARFVLDRGRK